MMDYQTIGQHVRIKLRAGDFDEDFLKAQNVNFPGPTDKDGAIAVFNQIAQKNDLKALRDPTGYMKQAQNVYDELHAAYEDYYTEALENAEDGIMPGGGYGEKAILNKLNSVIRKDMKSFVPEGMNYTDLRFEPLDDKKAGLIDDLAKSRVKLTQMHTIKRSVEKNSFLRASDDFHFNGLKLGQEIAKDFNLKPPKIVMSKKRLLDNSQNNQTGLKAFIKHLQDPEQITLNDQTGDCMASFSENDKNNAKFLIANKHYLKNYGFKLTKAAGAVNVSWASEQTKKMYQERQNLSLGSALNDLSEKASNKAL